MISNRLLKGKKTVLLVVAVVIILILGLFNVPFKREIDIRDESSIYQFNNFEYSNRVSISIRGVYYSYLLKPDRFVGQISIDEYPYTSEYEMLEIEFHNGMGDLSYDNTKDGNIEMKSIGNLIVDKKFENVLILIYEDLGGGRKHWSTEDGLFMAIPSENRADAIEKTKEISVYSKWLNSADWTKTR